MVLGVPAPDPEPDALPLPLTPLPDPLLGLEAGGGVVLGLVLLLGLPGVGLVEGEDFDDDPDDDPLFGPRSHAASASAAATAAAKLRYFAFNMVKPPWLSSGERHCVKPVVPGPAPFSCVAQ